MSKETPETKVIMKLDENYMHMVREEVVIHPEKVMTQVIFELTTLSGIIPTDYDTMEQALVPIIEAIQQFKMSNQEKLTFAALMVTDAYLQLVDAMQDPGWQAAREGIRQHEEN